MRPAYRGNFWILFPLRSTRQVTQVRITPAAIGSRSGVRQRAEAINLARGEPMSDRRPGI